VGAKDIKLVDEHVNMVSTSAKPAIKTTYGKKMNGFKSSMVKIYLLLEFEGQNQTKTRVGWSTIGFFLTF
jgi:hypothetical protein